MVSSKSVIIFHGDKLEVLYLDIIPLAGFFNKATSLFFEVNFKNMKGPIFGSAQRDLFDFRTNTS